MAKPTIVTRAGKGSALTWTEGDSNFTNLRDATITIKGGTGGTDVSSDLNGTITIVAGSGISVSGDNTAKTVTIANTASSAYPQITDDTTTNASRYVLFDDATSGDASSVGVSSTKLYFNPSSGVLTATSFSGALTGNASSATYASSVTLTADNSTNATNYPLFSANATGNESPRTDTGFTYNPSTGVLTATSFSGSLTGTASKATNLVGGNGTTLLGSLPYQSGTDTTSLLSPNTTTTQKFLTQVGDGTNGMAPMWSTISSLDNVTIGSVTPAAGSFNTLTVRSANQLRFNNTGNTYYAAFKAGTMASNIVWTLPSTDGTSGQFLQTDGGGNLVFATASGSSAYPQITDDTTTNASRYILFDNVTTGDASTVGVSSTKLTFNPSSGVLTATSFSGSLTGNASSATYASSVTLTADNSTNATNYPLFVANATGNESPRTDTGFTYNPATGTLIATYFTGQASKASNLVGGNSTTLYGAMPWQSGTDTTNLLNPNTTTTLKYLTQVGDGTNGMAPMWSTIASLNNVIIGSATAAAGTFTTLTVNAANDLRLADTDSSNYVGFKAPATVSANKIWTLPGADGTNNQLLKTDGAGTLSFTDTVDGTNKIGYRNIPPVGTKTGSYSLATTDVGKYVQVGSGGSITIPDATFAEGDAIVIANNTTGNITITCSITTAYIAGTDTDKASVTLATRGVANILFLSSTVCIISGNVT